MEQTRTRKLGKPRGPTVRRTVAALLTAAASVFIGLSVILAGFSGFLVGGAFSVSIWPEINDVPTGPILGSMVGCSMSLTKAIVSASFGTRRFGCTSIILGAVFWLAATLYLPTTTWLALGNEQLMQEAKWLESIVVLGALFIFEVGAGSLTALALDRHGPVEDHLEDLLRERSSIPSMLIETRSSSSKNARNEQRVRVIERLRSIFIDQCSDNPSGWAKVSQRELARSLNCSVSTVNGCLHALEDEGVIELRTKPRTRFRFPVDASQGGANAPSDLMPTNPISLSDEEQSYAPTSKELRSQNKRSNASFEPVATRRHDERQRVGASLSVTGRRAQSGTSSGRTSVAQTLEQHRR